jgi:hypothetical protein
MNIDVSELQFCNEKWDEMESAGPDRRMCERCSRPVVDMRGLTLDEVLEIQLMSGERVCGLYSPDQFAPAAATPPRRARSPLVTLALGASLLAARAQAQTTAAPAAREQVQLPPGAAPVPETHPAPQPDAAAKGDTILIHGRITGADGLPVATATVVAGGQTRAITDISGGFTLRVRATHGEHLEVLVTRLGYATRTLPVRVTGRQLEVNTTLAPQAVGMMEIVVTDPEAGTRRRSEGFSVARINLSDP